MSVVNIVCQHCHTVNDPHATSCERCGARFCPFCHLVVDSPTATICPHCGKKDPHFKPGKYVPPAGSIETGHCTNCGSRMPYGTRKCPYCGKLGTLITQAPVQGYGMMQSAPDAYVEYHEPQQQKVCAKCGRPIPPGSSLCPVHSKYGGGSTLQEEGGYKTGRHTGDLWKRIEEKRAASAAEPVVPHTHRTPPQDIYPQMGAPQMPPQETYEQPYAEEDQRTCPACGIQVPNRSKVCPNCGCDRLPPERTKPIVMAQDYYKAKQSMIEPISSGFGYEQNQYFEPPVEQPYESMYSPDFVEFPEKKSRKKPKKTKEKATTEKVKKPRPANQKFPFALLLAIIALGGLIILGIIFILDQLNTPAQPVFPTSSSTSGTTANAPVISNIQYSDVTRTSAVITWKTDKNSTSSVIYCLNSGNTCETINDNALVTNHNLKLTGLKPGEGYHITVKSRQSDSPNAAETSKESSEVLRTLAVPDSTAPVITTVKVTNLVSASNLSTAEITWKTDEPSTSQVSYGTSNLLGSLQPAQSDTNLTTFHDVQLYGLPVETTIHYKVISRDADGNESTSPITTFTTPPPAGTTVGNMAPDFTLTCAADGKTVTLSELRGSKAIINFWHVYCSPCVGELPAFQQLHEKYPDLPVLCIHGTALGIIDPTRVGSMLQDNGYTFTVPLDSNGQVSSLYNITSVPRTFLLDGTGVIRKIKDGSFGSISEIETLLNSY